VEVDKLRSAIRHKKKCREVRMAWAKLAGIASGILLGIIGALTGLAAVIRK
jgi:hypothetical protein